MTRLLTLSFVLILVLCSFASGQTKPEQLQKTGEKVPVSYGLVVDNSGSFRILLDRVITAVSEVVEENSPEDEAFLVTFVNTQKIVLRQEFTNKKSDLHDAAQNMFIEGGQTAILDAVKSSADYLAQNARTEPGRGRALILVTDGEDRASESKIDDVLKILKEQNIRVFVIAMAEGKVFMKLLDRLTKETGGTIATPRTKVELAAAAKELSAAMHSK